MTNKEQARRIKELEKLLLVNGIIEEKNNEKISYPYSKMSYKKLKKLVSIKRILDKSIFEKWFNNDIKLENSVLSFFKNLLEQKGDLINLYNEEDLKMQFIAPILNHINFTILDKEIRFFSEESLNYETDNFIFSGESDFFIAKGLEIPEKPYFFIQEFKQSEQYGNPRPQLLAELISAVELNNWTTIKGVYIIGTIWNFVILQKLGVDKYQYFVSKNFDSSDINGLTAIYKNLLFIKNEVIEMIDRGE